MSTNQHNYRPEIDGLRALAILAVIFFHAGFKFIPGGFTGVDIFFVISGFLITSIVINDLTHTTFSFSKFYERRIRRIVPALIIILIYILASNYFVHSPFDYKNTAKSVFASIFFLGNVVAYQQTDYFDAATEYKPAVHLWSLGVEEQFYLMAPLVIVFLFKTKKHYFFVSGLILVSLVSFFHSEYLLSNNARLAFYSIFSRAWELLIGSIAAVILSYMRDQHLYFKPRTALILSWLGIALIFYSFFCINQSHEFPGFNALFPTIGSALFLIFANPNQSSSMVKFMSSRPLVWIGLISYSAYLWHQPVFSFFRYINPNDISIWIKISLIIIIIFSSYLTYRFIEQPFRDSEKVSRKFLYFFIFSSASLLTAASIYTYSKNGLPERFNNLPVESISPFKINESNICRFDAYPNDSRIKICWFGDTSSQTTVFLHGDSHASVILGGLDEKFKRINIRGFRVKVDGCPHFIPGMIAGEVTAHKIELISSCRQSYDNLFQYIKSLNADVIFNLRWASRFSPIEGKYNDFAFDNQKGGVELKPNIANYALNSNKNWETSAIAKHNALTNFLNNLASASNRLIIIYPTPEPGWDLPKYNFSRYLQNGSVDRDITIDKNLFDHRQHFVKQVIDGLKTPNMFRIYPSNYMCTSFENTCFIQKDFNAYFYDTNHLSYLGARPIVNEIVEILTDKNSLADRSKSETR